jgi:hypothetical protein
MLQLPFDVLISIVETLTQDIHHNWTENPYDRSDPRTDTNLCSLSLTNKALHSIVQPIQFRQVCLDNFIRAKSLFEVTSTHPEILGFIKTLEIDADMGADITYLIQGMENEHYSWISWLWSEDGASMLSQLANTKTLVITRWDSSRHPHASGEVAKGMDSLLALTGVTCVRFRFNWNLRLRLWDRFGIQNNITDLTIDGTNILIHSTSNNMLLRETYPDSVGFSCLKSLYISYENLVGGSERSGRYSDMIEAGWGIPNFPNLLSLDLDMRAIAWDHHERMERRISVDPFVQYLTTLTNGCVSLKLRSLRLRFVDGRTMLYEYEQDPWLQALSVAPHLIGALLDSLLIAEPSFQNIHLTVVLACIAYNYDEMQLRVQTLLPQLRAQGRLTVCREQGDQDFDDLEVW